MSTEPASIAEALPIEQARVRELIGHYRDLPNNAGAFGIMMMEQELRAADQAVMSSDVIAMIQAYEALKGCE